MVADKDSYRKIVIGLDDPDCPFSEESIWATSKGDYYQIKNIPFYAESFALEDVVSVTELNGKLYVESLHKPSGHSVIQMVFFDTKWVMDFKRTLKGLGCTSELFNHKTQLAVDIPKDVSYDKIKILLDEGFDLGKWDYKEACLGFL